MGAALWFVVAGIAVATGWLVWLVWRQVTAHAWAERDDDLIVKRGRLFRSVTVVPYGRMQYVEVSAGPVARALGIARVQLHTAPPGTDAHLSGAPADAAARPPDEPRRGAPRRSVSRPVTEPPVAPSSAPEPAPHASHVFVAPREWTRMHPVSPVLKAWPAAIGVGFFWFYTGGPSWLGGGGSD